MKATTLKLEGSNYPAVNQWLRRNGLTVSTANEATKITQDTILVLPGVLNFDEAMTQITQRGFKSLIVKHVENQGKVVGICCGMQVLFADSEEGKLPGIGIFDQRIRRIPEGKDHTPNVGWKTATEVPINPNSIETELRCYFMHRYALLYEEAPKLPNARILTANCNIEFVSAILSNQFLLTQFHPEKSYTSGNLLLKEFILNDSLYT